MLEEPLLDRRTLLVSGAALLLAGTSSAAGEEILAETITGRIRGTRVGEVSSFKGIPYGADTRLTRFAAPRPVAAWSGVREATAYGPAAPQSNRDAHVLTRSWRDGSRGKSEDCLVLNVWTRGGKDGRKRPVMVWFHGGGFGAGTGASSVYDGTRLCEQGDVVVITVNHRLNVFGYLYLAQLGDASFADSGNAGMLDLVLALQWVRDNVAAFGGDAGNVTIFGESGGGGKVSFLLGMPAARGLFHKAIIQSGAFPKGITPAAGTQRAQKYLAGLGLDAKTLPKLRELSTEQLLAALGGAATLSDRMAYSPVVDGRTLPRDPFWPDANPLSEGIPILIGNTGWEYIYQYGQQDEGNFSLTWEALPARIGATMQELGIPGDAAATIAEYRRLRPKFAASEVYFAIIADGRPIINSQLLADRAAARKRGAVYMYRLDWETPVDGGRWRSAHVLDVPFVFDNIVPAVSMTGTGATQDRLAAQMSGAWLAFARSGNPGTKALPDWPTYDTATRSTLIFDERCTVQKDPGADVRRLWTQRYA